MSSSHEVILRLCTGSEIALGTAVINLAHTESQFRRVLRRVARSYSSSSSASTEFQREPKAREDKEKETRH